MLIGEVLERLHNYKRIFCILTLFMLVCLFCLSACGSSVPDHPLTENGSPTSTVDSTANTGDKTVKIQPIIVKNDATSLSTFPGGYMDMKISTSPFAQCSIVIDYGLKKPSHAPGVVPVTTDSQGIAAWHWKVDETAHTGVWPLTISAILSSGSRATLQVNVTVTLAPISVVSSQTNLRASPNGSMSMTIATAPGVDCRFQVLYMPAGQTGRVLTTRADTNGIAVWNWKVGRTAVPGVWPTTIVVTLVDGEQSFYRVNMVIL